MNSDIFDNTSIFSWLLELNKLWENIASHSRISIVWIILIKSQIESLSFESISERILFDWDLTGRAKYRTNRRPARTSLFSFWDQVLHLGYWFHFLDEVNKDHEEGKSIQLFREMSTKSAQCINSLKPNKFHF